VLREIAHWANAYYPDTFKPRFGALKN